MNPGEEKNVKLTNDDDIEKILATSEVLKPDFMQKTSIAPYFVSKKKAKEIRKVSFFSILQFSRYLLLLLFYSSNFGLLSILLLLTWIIFFFILFFHLYQEAINHHSFYLSFLILQLIAYTYGTLPQ